MMQPVYISTTYLGPVQQYCKLFQYPEVHLETAENYPQANLPGTVVPLPPPTVR